MKKLGLILFSAALLTGCASYQPLAVQEEVNLTQYMGKWYEQARLPNRFQEHCVGEVSAQYQLLEANQVSVENQCVTDSGETTTAKALARLNDSVVPPNTAMLEVRFAPAWLSWWPGVWGDYWIMRIEGHYEYALVGTPDRKYLWVLSREQQGDTAVVQQLLNYAAEQGFDIDKVTYTAP